MEQSQHDVERPPVSVNSINTLTAGSDGETSVSSFVDLVVLQHSSHPYPAKYRSWLKILVFVVFTDWFTTEAGFVPWLRDTFALSENGALLVFLTIVVGILLYSALDVLNFICPGLQSWLNQPRIQWVKEYKNVPVECIAVVVGILEDGFRMFDTPPDLPAAMIHASKLPFDHGTDHEESGKSEECTLKIHHKIRKDKVAEFRMWRSRLLKTMGLLDDKPKHGVKSVHWDPDKQDENQETVITFHSIDDLNAYMQSPVRLRFIRSLQPMLVAPSQVKLRSNAIADLCYTQGHERPAKEPKKWKIWILTTMAMYMVVLFVNNSLPHYLDVWGLNAMHERVPALVRNICTTYLNAYIATPFMTMVFRHWLRREENDEEEHQPWIFLSEGTESILFKTLIFFCFYGGNALAWFLQT